MFIRQSSVMRILMLSKAVVVGIYQRKLEEMARLPGVELTVITSSVWQDSSGPVRLERAYMEGYNLLVEPIRFNGNFHAYHFPTLARRLRDFNPHVVHIDEEPYNFAAWHSLWLARRAKAKSLFFSWQNILKHYPIPFSIGERYVLKHVDYALAGTASAAEVWCAKGYTGPMAVIPQFGVDPDFFSPVDRQRGPDGPFVIGFVGRLVPEKGVDLLLRTAAALPGNWQLRIIGQGPEREPLQRLAETLGISDRVTFTAQMPSLQIVDAYRALDVLIVPSRTLANWKEQFGRVITEAMSCGIPVIGSDSGAIPDLIGDAGLTFPEDRADALSDRLQNLMNTVDLRHDLSQRGRARVLAMFTHRQIAAQTVDVYQQMLSKS
jgi:glycosyltransferase involved in cell wall biosynthesis